MASGIAHCSGGPGLNTFDTLTALERWVEEGVARDKLIASHTTLPFPENVVTKTPPPGDFTPSIAGCPIGAGARVGIMTDAGRALVAVVGGRISTGRARWPFELEASRLDPGALAAAFASASRFLGKAPVSPSPRESELLRAAGLDWPIAHVGIDEAARMALLVQAADRAGEAELVSLVEDLYRRGENRERQSVLRSLPVLPRPERFLALAVDSCRTSVQSIFEAIACENPYPAAFFPELNFNQMVLKALFIEVALERILGLKRRITPELRRMANDYASERAAAGRTIPQDIALLV